MSSNFTRNEARPPHPLDDSAATLDDIAAIAGSAPPGGAPSVDAAQQSARVLGLDRLDAQLLLLHALRRPLHDRAWLLAHDEDPLDTEVHVRFRAMCLRRASGEPVAYLVGEKEFFGLLLHVDARVLVPRPDTEVLVEWALQALAGLQAACVLDLGTGSGAIALALQKARPDVCVEAVDASDEALAVARANARRLGLQVRFRNGDWLQGTIGRRDVIVSNPPYVAEGDPHLEALAHEPRRALVAGADGLDDIRAIVAQAPAHLASNGWLLLEHGHDQAGAVRQLLRDAGFAAVQSRTDIAGIERCSGGRWPPRG